MKRAELVFVPYPGVGHLVPTLEIAKLLVKRDLRLSVTFLIINSPTNVHSNSMPYLSSLTSSTSERIRFVNLPLEADRTTNALDFLTALIEKQKSHVKDVVADIIQSVSRSESTQLAGFVVDAFCMPMIDVANEFRVPTYIYFTSSAGMLSLTFHLLREHNRDAIQMDKDLVIPGFANPIPPKVLRLVLLESGENTQMSQAFLNHRKRFMETKGILVNTFTELESSIINYLLNGTPMVYPVGPILNINNEEPQDRQKYDDIMKWLDNQPASSVVFLCFGSTGSFPTEQVKEIAVALENKGCRFLWSLRQAPPEGKIATPSDYNNFADILPEGFLDRTAKIGRVIGWAPQVAILAHPAIRGFVSHCGWNSTLESIWFGVPIATWPLYAEQQFNAFCLLKEFELAEEITMTYRKNLLPESKDVISARVIERGIRGVMELDEGKRKKLKGMSEKSRKALEEGGSSYNYLGQFIEDVFKNMT